MDAGFKIELKEDGVYLTAAPSCSCSLTELIGALKERGIENYDGDAVMRAIDEKLGVPVRIAAPVEEGAEDAEAKIRVSEDGLTCEALVLPPVGAGKWPTLEQIRGLMHSNGVTYGYREDEIERMIRNRVVREWVAVARGDEPENGRDARIECKIDLNVLRPKAIGDNVDMRELGTVINVIKGQEIAEKIPAVSGKEGQSVMGKRIPAYIGKDKNIVQGKGTLLSEDGMRITAEFDGNLKLAGGVFSVHPFFEVRGDVDYSVGNIDFVGPVVVRGSVREGFEVRSGGNISIGGVVEGATVSSSGDMQIKVGVRGAGKARIKVGGNMYVGYIDQACVRCDGNIEVGEAVLHSDIGANGEIVALGSKKGHIAGGRVQAGTEVACEILGSEMGTRTDVIVGILPELAEERKRCIEIIRELGEKLPAIESNIEFLKGLQRQGSLSEKRLELLAKITKAKFQMRAQHDASVKRLSEIESDIEKNKSGGRVRVHNVCHPGVSVTIRGVRYLVREPLRFTRFVYEDGEIKLKPFD